MCSRNRLNVPSEFTSLCHQGFEAPLKSRRLKRPNSELFFRTRSSSFRFSISDGAREELTRPFGSKTIRWQLLRFFDAASTMGSMRITQPDFRENKVAGFSENVHTRIQNSILDAFSERSETGAFAD